MTNSSKKPATVSRDNLDLDLEARLDQATSTMPLDDEPSTGDALDQILARAKKEIETDSPETLTSVDIPELRTEDDDIVELKNTNDFRPIKSDTMTSMEKQLTATMNASINAPQEDDELDRLLGGSGFDFDSLFGEAVSDEIVTDIPEINEDSVMAAVDELLNIGVMEDEEIAVKPESKPKKTRAKAKIAPEIVVDEIAESEPDLVAEPEIVVEALDEIIEPEENELGSDDELTVEPEVALDDLVDAVPFDDTLKVDFEDDTEIENFSEEFNNVDDVADSVAPLVEISTSDESLDDFNEVQLDELNEIMENKNDTITAGFDLLDDENLEKESSISVTQPESEDDWMKQLENLDEESDKTEEIAEDDDWMKQLDGLDEEESVVEKPAIEEEMVVEDVAEDDDWMKQLEGLDEEESAVEEPATEEKMVVEDVAEDDDWMKQLENLDEESDKTEEVADDDDWMKQLEGMDDHDEDTAKMLMDAGHDDSVKSVVEDNFNIANETDEKPTTRVIDEDAIITKAADLAITQFKSEQDQALSQLRVDQDTIDSKNKKQFTDAEQNRKKTATFSYLALGVGVIGLLGSAGIGWLSYGTKDKTETLTQSVTALEEKVDLFLAKNPEKEIENLKTSVEQLNQKVEKLAVAQVAMTPSVVQPIVENGKVPTSEAVKTNVPVVLPNNKVAPTSPKVEIDSNISPVSIAPEIVVREKENESTKLKEMAKKTAEAEKAEALLLSQKIAKANAVAKAASMAKPLPKTERTNYYKGRTTRGMAHPGTEERSNKTTKPKAIEPSNVTAAPSKEILNTTIAPKKAVSVGKYAVNVISYQQEWFAQSKAAEFKQKGIPVEVIPVDANNHSTRYRLAVNGFKNKAEANAYAEKIKKQHDLNETWVGSNP